MTELKLRAEFQGLIITRLFPGLGNVTFNTIKTNKTDYENFANIGFADLFTRVEVCEKCKGEKCICTSPKTIKYEGVPQKKADKKDGRI